MKNLILKLAAPLALLCALAYQQHSATAGETGVVIAAPTVDLRANGETSATAIFAGGCFWGMQGVFQHVTGVTSAVSGYAGGDARSASYEAVSSGATGHAESVKITYDPKQISYGKLLQIYFSVAHDPTQLNRQGPDTGTQYRSAIFPQSPEQRAVAEKYIAQLDASRAYKKPLVTRIESGKTFYAAEAYHQNYMTLHPNEPYIVSNELPKLANLKRIVPDLYRPEAVLLRNTL